MKESAREAEARTLGSGPGKAFRSEAPERGEKGVTAMKKMRLPITRRVHVLNSSILLAAAIGMSGCSKSPQYFSIVGVGDRELGIAIHFRDGSSQRVSVPKDAKSARIETRSPGGGSSVVFVEFAKGRIAKLTWNGTEVPHELAVLFSKRELENLGELSGEHGALIDVASKGVDEGSLAEARSKFSEFRARISEFERGKNQKQIAYIKDRHHDFLDKLERELEKKLPIWSFARKAVEPHLGAAGATVEWIRANVNMHQDGGKSLSPSERTSGTEFHGAGGEAKVGDREVKWNCMIREAGGKLDWSRVYVATKKDSIFDIDYRAARGGPSVLETAWDAVGRKLGRAPSDLLWSQIAVVSPSANASILRGDEERSKFSGEEYTPWLAAGRVSRDGQPYRWRCGIERGGKGDKWFTWRSVFVHIEKDQPAAAEGAKQDGLQKAADPSFPDRAGLSPEADGRASAVAPKMREWKDATGKRRIMAVLVSVKDGAAVLRKADGTEVTVPLERLSAADREYLDALAGGGVPSHTFPADKPAAGKVEEKDAAEMPESGLPERSPPKESKPPDEEAARAQAKPDDEATREREIIAARKLQSAKRANVYAARRLLGEIVAGYPDTKAGREARAILDRLPGGSDAKGRRE